MKAEQYEIRIWYSGEPGDECFVAQVLEMPGIMAHGDTREEAAREIQAALELAIEVATQHGDELPKPRLHSAASALGRIGGSVSSLAKRKASRTNGAKGGRPKKKQVEAAL